MTPTQPDKTEGGLTPLERELVAELRCVVDYLEQAATYHACRHCARAANVARDFLSKAEGRT